MRCREARDIMKQRLTIDQIYEKEFHVDFKGYNALEVDEFLDTVLKDYQTFEAMIAKQKDLLDRYEEAMTRQKQQIQQLQQATRAQADVEPQTSYVDLVRRISRIEAYLFNKE